LTKHYKIIGRKAEQDRLSDPRRIGLLVSTLAHDCQMTLLDTPWVFTVELQLKRLGRIPFEDEGDFRVLGVCRQVI